MSSCFTFHCIFLKQGLFAEPGAHRLAGLVVSELLDSPRPLRPGITGTMSDFLYGRWGSELRLSHLLSPHLFFCEPTLKHLPSLQTACHWKKRTERRIEGKGEGREGRRSSLQRLWDALLCALAWAAPSLMVCQTMVQIYS